MILKSQDSVSKVLWNSNQKPISSSFWTFSSITKDYKKRTLGSATSVCNELDGLFSTCVRFVLDVGLGGKSAVLKCLTIVKRLQSYEWSFTLVADFSVWVMLFSKLKTILVVDFQWCLADFCSQNDFSLFGKFLAFVCKLLKQSGATDRFNTFPPPCCNNSWKP